MPKEPQPVRYDVILEHFLKEDKPSVKLATQVGFHIVGLLIVPLVTLENLQRNLNHRLASFVQKDAGQNI